MNTKNIDDNKVFDRLIYAQCWEDPEIDRKAFRIGPDDTIFSITSGGCNVLAFLLDDPRNIISLDINSCQNHMLAIKMAAFRNLDYDMLLQFIGVLPNEDRLSIYKEIRNDLPSSSLAYWNNMADTIKHGIIHAGMYEKYMRLLRKWLFFLMGKKKIEKLYELAGIEERTDFYNHAWDNFKWRMFTRLFLSRRLMTYLFTGAFFEQIEGSFSFGDHFRNQVRHALVDLPLKENHFLRYILHGNYSPPECLPVYLKKENYELIRKRLGRIQIVTNSCDSFLGSMPDNSISKFNFTNIFEWMPAHAFDSLLKEVYRVGKPNAVLTYRNLLVPRSRPTNLSGQIFPLAEVSNSLHTQDLSFIYRKYVVEQITK